MEEGLVVRGRVEIDMRRPFNSVKEAVMLFGEKVLAGEVYAGQKLKQSESIQGENNNKFQTKVGAIAAELQETKQNLEKAKEEDLCMAYYLASLKQELEETKSELKLLKSRRESYHSNQFSPVDKEIEEVKFIENPIRAQVNHPEKDESESENGNDDHLVFEKKRSVKFASPPSLTKLMVEAPKMQETSPSLKKKPLRKTIIPSLGGIFSRKKQDGQSPTTPKSIK